MEFLLLLTAGVDSGTGFMQKKLMTRGLSPKEYFYYVTLPLVPLSAMLFLFYPFTFAFSLVAIMLLIASAVVRAVSIVTFSKALKNITPLTISIYSTMAVLITYTIDLMIGALRFNIVHLFALSLVALGSFVIILRNTGAFKGVKTSVIIRVLTEVLKGYLAYFTLMYLNNAMYIFGMAVLTSVVILFFTKKFTNNYFNKNKLKDSAFTQMFGVIGLTFGNLLAQSSATLFMLKAPATLVVTLFLSYIIRKDVGNLPTKIELIGSVIVITGLTLFSVLQF